MISTYSCIWTFLNCGMMAVVILFLRKRTSFLIKYGTSSLVFLSLACVIRMFLPFEFPKFQYVFRDPYIFSKIVSFVRFADDRLGLTPKLPIIWICGMFVALIRFLIKKYRIIYMIKNFSGEDDGRLSQYLSEMDASCKLPIRLSTEITIPTLVGTVHPKIYFPIYDYAEDEEKYILLHEYTHWKRKDPWKKLFLHMSCVILWWNPVIYFFRDAANKVMEFHCDKELAKEIGELKVIEYLETLKASLEKTKPTYLDISLHTIELINTKKIHMIQQRFELLLNSHQTMQQKIFYRMQVVIFVAIWIISSYYFILQPKYDTPDSELWGEETTLVADEENAYLVEQEDGSYLFYYYGTPEKVSKEDVEAGYYYIYPIKNQEDLEEDTWFSKISEWFLSFKQN